eukprot:scaffold78647_cov49-Attheya_sp.AAC.5
MRASRGRAPSRLKTYTNCSKTSYFKDDDKAALNIEGLREPANYTFFGVVSDNMAIIKEVGHSTV